MNKATPLELAASDYGLAASYFEDLADYLVINVSSPNTPGLRSLQNEESLRKIISEVQNTIGNWSRVPPVLLKLAPEVQDEPLSKIFELGTQVGISGWVLTNTLGGAWIDSIPGGWSGKILTEASRASLRAAVSQTKLPIISVGGIMTPTEANDRLKSGASLIQIYSGWIFSGPRFPNEINKFLKNQLK
jgi:dihydroorotate dehydrogenase